MIESKDEYRDVMAALRVADKIDAAMDNIGGRLIETIEALRDVARAAKAMYASMDPDIGFYLGVVLLSEFHAALARIESEAPWLLEDTDEMETR